MIKKILPLFIFAFLLIWCDNNQNLSSNKEYKNKLTYSRETTVKKYDLEDKYNTNKWFVSIEETMEIVKLRENSPIAANKTESKIYSFNDDGTKIMEYLDVEKYEYVIDDVNLDKEKEYYEKTCNNYSKERYSSRTIKIDNKTLIITKVNNLSSEMNQDLVENTTKESMKNSYIGDELFTCTE